MSQRPAGLSPRGLSPKAPVPPELPDWARVERVLLIRLRSIGDTVLMTPCLGALKSLRPDIRITVVSEPLAAPLLEHHPLVDQLVVSGRGIGARIDLIQKLRRARFDVAFNLHGGSTATIVAALSGAGTTVGYQGYRYSGLLKMRAPSPDVLLGRQRLHSVEQQLALLCWAGVSWPAEVKLSLQVSADALASVGQRPKLAGIGSEGYAVLSGCASAESKRWPAASFARVADYLRRRYQLTSVVIAGPGEEAIARNIAELSRGCAVDVTRLDLKELVALIGHSSVFVGNDSGPMHIAAALDRPLVAIFGGSNPAVWSPWTTAPHRLLIAPSVQRQRGEIGSARAGAESASEVRDIARVNLEEVLAAVDDVMLARAANPAE